MYCELFQLNEPPFRLTPDPQFLFASKQHARAKAYMESTIWLADGFVVITGDIGSGKTTLIEAFLAELSDNVVLAHVNQTQLSPVEFLQALLVEFGFKPFRMRKIELLTMLRDYMVEQYAAGKQVLLVVDEAQNLPRAVLEEIRMLSGIEAQKEKLLRIILAGQPELSSKLDSPQLEQLTQRVRLRFHLSALSKRETREYIEHRLEVSGARGRSIFTDEAFDAVFRYSGGVPRLTNIICDTAMLCAFGEERDTVDAEMIKAAAEELQWVEHGQRARERKQAQAGGSTGRYLGPASESPASLELLFRDQLVTHHPLPQGRTIIGRTADNDVQIRSKFISRHHAQITFERDHCTIEDLNSTNGMFIGARRVKQHVLHDGDAVQLGEHRLVYRVARRTLGQDEHEDHRSTVVPDWNGIEIDGIADATDAEDSDHAAVNGRHGATHPGNVAASDDDHERFSENGRDEADEEADLEDPDEHAGFDGDPGSAGDEGDDDDPAESSAAERP